MRSDRFFQGFRLSWMISDAAIALDKTPEERVKGYNSLEELRKIIQSHYEDSKSKNALGYNIESTLAETLALDVIPDTFGITQESCKIYGIPDYLAGLELVLEQFQDLEHADSKRLNFLRTFIVDLGNKRLSRLESPIAYRGLVA